MAKKIALVDDEKTIVTTLKIALEEEGFEVTGFTDSEQALPQLLNNSFDAAILDVKMPRMDGLELLETVRQSSQMPIIMLTSKDHEVDEMLGLRMGADDYIKKPFSIRLVLARLHACLRRYSPRVDTSVQDKSNVITLDSLSLDLDRHVCMYAGQNVNLTVTEFLLLHTLLEKPGHVRSRMQLMDTAYGENIHVEDRAIDSHIKRIRRKLRQVDPKFDRIETLYGVGYRYQK